MRFLGGDGRYFRAVGRAVRDRRRAQRSRAARRNQELQQLADDSGGFYRRQVRRRLRYYSRAARDGRARADGEGGIRGNGASVEMARTVGLAESPRPTA